MKHGRKAELLLAMAWCLGTAWAGQVHVAVASNFAQTLQKIAPLFTQDTGHTLLQSSASTAKLAAQVQQGAPFQVLLTADSTTAQLLETAGHALPGTRFTYATGQLALWSADPQRLDGRPEVLKVGNFKRLSIANPKVAPYGAAAVQVIDKLGLTAALAAKLVTGENIAQTHQFVATGNAELGFVALSQVMLDGQMTAGSFWLVPASMHAPLRQEAVLLKAGKDQAAAMALLAYLKGDKARAAMLGYGYRF